MATKKHFKKIKKFFSKNKWLKKTEGWIWLVLLIGTIMYFKWSLIEAGLATERLVSERQQFQTESEKQQSKTRQLQQEMQAQISSPMVELTNMLQNINNYKINAVNASSTVSVTEKECKTK